MRVCSFKSVRSSEIPWLLALLAIAATLFAAIAPVLAAPDEGRAMRPQDAESGRLFFRSDDGQSFTPAPLVHTDVKIAASGMVARATVRQRFHNPTGNWMEGIYVFPLPHGAAVDRLRLEIGDRVILGRIEERQQAARTYQQARAQGQRAGLIEQERPNIFTTSVANIGPDETVTVEIEYQDAVRYDQGQFSLRFPLVVAPRYIPGQAVIASSRGWAPGTTQVPDAPRITPPVRDPAVDGVGNPVSLRVEIDAGLKLAAVDSVTHKIKLEAGSNGRVIATLAEASVPADRDFELTWKPELGSAPEAGVFVENRDGQRHLLVMLMPPSLPANEIASAARETIFVIDTSGSMEGTSIRQAKAALKLALDRLAPTDRFNIIEFNSVATALFGRPQTATPATVQRAHDFVDGLRARGGTEMMKALDLALDGETQPNRLRQVVFMTDGAVGNEEALFQRIRAQLGDTRLFTVGIGSAPNGWFLSRSAEVGRGTFTNIDRLDEVGTRMAALFMKLEKPVLTDIAVAWPKGVRVETHPNPVPDLYAGEPVVVTARIDGDALPAGTTIEISGRAAGQPWTRRVSLDMFDERPGVAALWARRKLAALANTLHEGAGPAEVRAESLKVALTYGLVSRYTSLVAVDATPARPDGAGLTSSEIPLNLPAGWNYQAVFGKDAAPAGATMRHGLAPAQTTAIATAEPSAPPLPQTATPAALHFVLGVLSLLLAAVLLVLNFKGIPVRTFVRRLVPPVGKGARPSTTSQ